MTVRSLLFWPHLLCGIVAGLVILIMSVTGVLLTYEKQMVAWADARRAVAVPAGTPTLSPAALIERAAAATGEAPGSLVLSQGTAPALLTVGSRRVLVDRRTGQFLGDSAPRLRAFFRNVTDWHRWLAMTGEQRVAGRAITGWSNLVFAFIVLSGMYLWLPRLWGWRHVRAVAWFRGGLRGKARDFNWHNTIGVWSVVPLIVVVASATVISYPWASNLAYRAMGEEPPPSGPRRAEARPGAGGRDASRAAPGGPDTGLAEGGPSLTSLDAALARAERHVDGWRTITLRVPSSATAPLSFTIDSGSGGEPHKRGTLTLDAASGAVAGWEPFSSNSPGRRLRTILRFAHTGEVLGLPGQTIAGIASAGGAFLVYTGLALSLRRFAAWRKRRGYQARQAAA